MSLPSGLPETIGDGETLTRFLLFSKWFSRENSRVKAEAFIPHPYHELSLSRVDSLAEDEIWPLAEPVAQGRGTLYGRADLTAEPVRINALDVRADEPPDRHANVIGWPALPDPKLQKALQKRIALKLAAKATLKLAP